jgi:SAM-dependent methyltransferase|tara:strand:+ start:747 stop:1352 length:606 start_codon:yes stop_codon:yes gene_type:complete
MIDLQLFKNIIKEGRHNTDLLDSYSPNQFKTKQKLENMIHNYVDINSNTDIVIFGCWYGSILIPMFKEARRITLIDTDDEVMRISKHRLFSHYKDVNLDYVVDDVFNWAPTAERIKWCDLIINTSCEHMRPMKELNLNTNAYFAYTSNNMFDIEGHINCVNNIEEFKKQLPDTAKVLSENEVTDERGSRYLIVGKYEKSNI